MAHRMNRREFLVRAAAGAAAPIAAAAAIAGDAPPGGPAIVDAHQHLWDLKKLRLAWTEGNERLHRSYSVEDYREAAAGLGVAKTVYVEVDVDAAQLADEAAAAIERCRRGELLAGAVIGGRPGTDGFAAYIRRFRESPEVKGVRQVLFKAEKGTSPFLADPFVKDIRLLGKLGLSFDICVASAQLADAARLADACPETSFILDHCGNPDLRAKDLSPWKRDLEAVARRKNLAGCKVSGFIGSAGGASWTAEDIAPIVRHVRDSFGPDRILFGGDWPVCTLAGTLRKWVEALRAVTADWREADRRALFAGNAVRAYRLAPADREPK